jgi:hypothetical protein
MTQLLSSTEKISIRKVRFVISFPLILVLSIFSSQSSFADVEAGGPYIAAVMACGDQGVIFYNAAEENPLNPGAEIAQVEHIPLVEFFNNAELSTFVVAGLGFQPEDGCDSDDTNTIQNTGTFTNTTFCGASPILCITGFLDEDSETYLVALADLGVESGITQYTIFYSELDFADTYGLNFVSISGGSPTAPVAPVAAPLPDPNQLSTITGTTASAADSSGNVTITVAGSFPETVRNIDVNGRRIAPSSWVQDSSTITFTVPAAASGSYEVQIWNGSFPVLQVQTVIATK